MFWLTLLFWLSVLAYLPFHFRRPLGECITLVHAKFADECAPWWRGFADAWVSAWKAKWQECPYGHPNQWVWDRGFNAGWFSIVITIFSAFVLMVVTILWSAT